MSTVINIRMKDETLAQTERLQKSLNAPSKSDVIRRAIQLNDVLATRIKDGGKIIIENKDGSKTQILIPGINA